MTRTLALALVGCAGCLLAAAWPVAAQDSGQTVRAAIPPQIARPAAQAPAPLGTATTGELEQTPNVRVEVTISYQVGQGPLIKRSASVLVAQGESGSLRSGNQVAVPTTSFVPNPSVPKTEGSATPVSPMTSFNYRSVGLNVDARQVRVQGTRAKVNLSIEVSNVDERVGEAAGRPPSFPSFSQSLSVVLDSGKPLVIAQTSDFVDNVERKQTVEVKATILR